MYWVKLFLNDRFTENRDVEGMRRNYRRGRRPVAGERNSFLLSRNPDKIRTYSSVNLSVSIYYPLNCNVLPPIQACPYHYVRPLDLLGGNHIIFPLFHSRTEGSTQLCGSGLRMTSRSPDDPHINAGVYWTFRPLFVTARSFWTKRFACCHPFFLINDTTKFANPTPGCLEQIYWHSHSTSRHLALIRNTVIQVGLIKHIISYKTPLTWFCHQGQAEQQSSNLDWKQSFGSALHPRRQTPYRGLFAKQVCKHYPPGSL